MAAHEMHFMVSDKLYNDMIDLMHKVRSNTQMSDDDYIAAMFRVAARCYITDCNGAIRKQAQ